MVHRATAYVLDARKHFALYKIINLYGAALWFGVGAVRHSHIELTSNNIARALLHTIKSMIGRL